MPSHYTLPRIPDGHMDHLTDEETYVLCNEEMFYCPNSAEHIITRNTERLFCEDGKMWWKRSLI